MTKKLTNRTSKYVTITGNCINNKPIVDGTSLISDLLNYIQLYGGPYRSRTYVSTVKGWRSNR